MDVPITQFRRAIFDLANRALEGETIRVSYEGRFLLLEPELKAETRFDKARKLNFLTNGHHSEIDDAEIAKIKAEMQAEWDKGWEEI